MIFINLSSKSEQALKKQHAKLHLLYSLWSTAGTFQYFFKLIATHLEYAQYGYMLPLEYSTYGYLHFRQY